MEAGGDELHDEYYWTFGSDPDGAVAQIRDAIVEARLRVTVPSVVSKGQQTGASHHLADTTIAVLDHELPLTREASPAPDAVTGKPNVPGSTIQDGSRRLSFPAASNLAARLHLLSKDQKAKGPSPIKRNASSATVTQASAAHPYPNDAEAGSDSDGISPSQSIVMPGYKYPPGTDRAIYSASGSQGWPLTQWIPKPARKMLAVPTALHFPTLLPFNSKKVFESHKIAADEEGDNSASALEDREKERFEIVSAVNLKEEYHAHFSSNEKEEVISRA